MGKEKIVTRRQQQIVQLCSSFRLLRKANILNINNNIDCFEIKILSQHCLQSRDFMHVLVTCKYKKDQIKNNPEKMETSFSPL